MVSTGRLFLGPGEWRPGCANTPHAQDSPHREVPAPNVQAAGAVNPGLGGQVCLPFPGLPGVENRGEELVGLLGQRPTLLSPRTEGAQRTLLWVKANPSGLVTISRKMSMLSRMEVKVESWPYSCVIWSGGRGQGGRAGQVGHRPCWSSLQTAALGLPGRARSPDAKGLCGPRTPTPPGLPGLTFFANQIPLAWVTHSREWMPVSIQMAGRLFPPVLNWMRRADKWASWA